MATQRRSQRDTRAPERLAETQERPDVDRRRRANRGRRREQPVGEQLLMDDVEEEPVEEEQQDADQPELQVEERLLLAHRSLPDLPPPIPAPRAENAKIDVKVIGASQEMCSYLPLLQKLPAALVIRKVKVTKHSSRVSLREIFT